MKRTGFPIAATWFLVACGSSSTSPTQTNSSTSTSTTTSSSTGSSCPPTPNNMATLAGGPIGAGTMPNESLARSVPVTVAAASDYAATLAYIMRSSLTSKMIYLAVPVTNTSGKFKCYIKAAGDVGTWHITETFLHGTVATTGSVFPTTCLRPCETGYILEMSESHPFDSASSVSLTLTDYDLGAVPAPGRIIPTGYDWSASRSLTATVTNLGALTEDLTGGYHRYIYMDENDHCLAWGFLVRAKGSSGVVAPSMSTVLADQFADGPYLQVWPGLASKVTVLVDFKDASPSGALSLATSQEILDQEAKVAAQRESLYERFLSVR